MTPFQQCPFFIYAWHCRQESKPPKQGIKVLRWPWCESKTTLTDQIDRFPRNFNPAKALTVRILDHFRGPVTFQLSSRLFYFVSPPLFLLADRFGHLANPLPKPTNPPPRLLCLPSGYYSVIGDRGKCKWLHRMPVLVASYSKASAFQA